MRDTETSRELVECFERLGPGDRRTLLAFARFLAGGSAAPDAAPADEAGPLPIERPPEETVIAAIRRLSATYHMLDKADMLHRTGALMAEHLMQGRSAVEVIDDLEAQFRRAWERHRSGD